ncbi:hypothetical protein FQR65_LT20819 [Abscondita terminalis]|nr:hypothetical protein FQR65_LT20819 [Abscondita terminalis]
MKTSPGASECGQPPSRTHGLGCRHVGQRGAAVPPGGEAATASGRSISMDRMARARRLCAIAPMAAQAMTPTAAGAVGWGWWLYPDFIIGPHGLAGVRSSADCRRGRSPAKSPSPCRPSCRARRVSPAAEASWPEMPRSCRRAALTRFRHRIAGHFAQRLHHVAGATTRGRLMGGVAVGRGIEFAAGDQGLDGAARRQQPQARGRTDGAVGGFAAQCRGEPRANEEAAHWGGRRTLWWQAQHAAITSGRCSRPAAIGDCLLLP